MFTKLFYGQNGFVSHKNHSYHICPNKVPPFSTPSLSCFLSFPPFAVSSRLTAPLIPLPFSSLPLSYYLSFLTFISSQFSPQERVGQVRHCASIVVARQCLDVLVHFCYMAYRSDSLKHSIRFWAQPFCTQCSCLVTHWIILAIVGVVGREIGKHKTEYFQHLRRVSSNGQFHQRFNAVCSQHSKQLSLSVLQ